MAREGRKQSWFVQFPLVLLCLEPCAGSKEQCLETALRSRMDGGPQPAVLVWALLHLCVGCCLAIAHACLTMAGQARSQEGLATVKDILAAAGGAGHFHT